MAPLTKSHKVPRRNDHSVQDPSKAAVLQPPDQHLPVVLWRADDPARRPRRDSARPRPLRLRQWPPRRSRSRQPMGHAGASDYGLHHWARQLGLAAPSHHSLHLGAEKAGEEGRQDELGRGSSQHRDGGVEQEVRHSAWNLVFPERFVLCRHDHLWCHTGREDSLKLYFGGQVVTSAMHVSALTWLIIVHHPWLLFVIAALIDIGESSVVRIS